MINTFLLNDFYTIEFVTRSDGKILAEVLLNQDHGIFKGHFEQMPVVPGVCQTQIIKEVLQKELQKNLMLAKGTNIKFMGMIVPTEHQMIQLEIIYKPVESGIIIDAKLFHENTTFTKFKGEFIYN